MSKVTLEALAARHGIAKSSDAHASTAVHERVLKHRRDEAPSVPEIGIFGGASLRMWYGCFPLARFFGASFPRPLPRVCACG